MSVPFGVRVTMACSKGGAVMTEPVRGGTAAAEGKPGDLTTGIR